MVSLHGASLALRLEHRGRHRSEGAKIPEDRPGSGKHLDHSDDTARQHHDNGTREIIACLGCRSEQAERGRRPHLGHQQSGKPSAALALEDGATGTHRNSYPGGKYAYLSAAAPGFSSNILVILDISDPAQPKEAGRWWMTGQREGETKPEGPEGFHGPANISPDGKVASMAYSPAAVNLDISDVTNPKLIGKLTFSPPFVAVGAPSLHTALPLWDRNLLYVNSEAIAERCNEALNFAGLVDNRNPARPRLMSLFPLPVPPKGAPYKNFCEKGGRFGPHNVNQEIHLPDVEKPGNLIYLTYFNAGLRVYNIKDPLLPVETGWFIPPQPLERAGALPRDLVSQTEDVLVDTRGYIYVTDKQWGLWILRYAGPDQPAPTDR